MKFNKEGWCASRVMAMKVVAIIKCTNKEFANSNLLTLLMVHNHKYYIYCTVSKVYTDNIDEITKHKMYCRAITWERTPAINETVIDKSNPLITYSRVYHSSSTNKWEYAPGQYPDLFKDCDTRGTIVPLEKATVLPNCAIYAMVEYNLFVKNK